MVISRSSRPRIRRWFAFTASAAMALGLVAGAVSGTISPAAADEPVPGVRGALIGDRTLPPGGGTITERVAYENLTPGQHYSVIVELLELDGSETGIQAVANFTPIANDSTLEPDVEIEVPAGFDGRTLVATVLLYQPSASGQPIASHIDLANPQLTVSVTAYPTPGVRGSLLTGAWLPSSGGTIIERVMHDDLQAGQQYAVRVEMRRQDGAATDISALADLTPIASDGTIEIELVVPATAAGETLVAFVSLYKPSADGTPVAIHHDLADPRQTVRVLGTPTVHGALVGERWASPSGWVATERIDYDNLTPGFRYTVAVFMVHPDGGASHADGTAVFTPTSPTGSVNVDMPIPLTEEGRTIIATAWLFAPSASDPSASHYDLHDPKVTMIVRGSPDVRSSVADAVDGDRIVSASGGTVIDTISFDQLVPGAEYTVHGVLVRGSDASATPLTSSRTFTAEATSGTVDVEYAVPSGYAGETLVSFQRLYAGTDTSVAPIAADEELDDPTQTVTVQTGSVQTASTPPMLAATGSASPALPVGLAAAVLASGLMLTAAVLAVTRRRRTT